MLDLINSIYGDVTVAVIVTVATLLCAYYCKRNRGLPPGPVSFPFFGYSLILKDETSVEILGKLQKKYGDVFSFTFAGTLFINLGSVKAHKEFHSNNSDCFRRSNDFSMMSSFFQHGIFCENGERWKILRKFALLKIREYGMTAVKENMCIPMNDSIKETIGYLKSKKGEPVEIVQYMTHQCNSIFRRTMFGEHVFTEQQVQIFIGSFIHMAAFIRPTTLLYSGFLSRFLLLFKPGYFEAKKSVVIMLGSLKKIVDDHKAKFNKDEDPNNFIDAYLKERYERSVRGDSTAKYFTDEALVATLKQFMGDGVLITAIFIAMFFTRIEEHQDKIYAEIVDVVGRERPPTMQDKSKLSFTNAYIYEIMRTSMFITLFPSQQCIKETVIRGYRIPKGAYTLMNLCTSHNDPAVYVEPEKFNPSRFLVEDRNKRPDLPIIFGVGRRNCIGESYVMAQVFLILSTIIQNFKISTNISEADSYDFSRSGNFKIRATPRNDGG